MTNEIIILVYIVVALTVNALINYFICVAIIRWHKDYVDNNYHLNNLIAERTDNGKKDN